MNIRYGCQYHADIVLNSTNVYIFTKKLWYFNVFSGPKKAYLKK